MVVMIFKGVFIAEMFSAFSAVFLFGWASFGCLFSFREFNKQTSTATSTMFV